MPVGYVALAGVRTLTGLVATAALALALGAAPARAQTGYAVYYNPGVMEERARVRNAPPAECYVAYTLAHDDDMARLWLRVAGPAGALECLVVDLPHPRDRPALVKRGIVVELGYENRWICGHAWSGRARECPVRIWRR